VTAGVLPIACGSGTVTEFPQPHLNDLPAKFAGVLNFFWQWGQEKFILLMLWSVSSGGLVIDGCRESGGRKASSLLFLGRRWRRGSRRPAIAVTHGWGRLGSSRGIL